MANLEQIIHHLNLTVLTQPHKFSDIIPTGGYTSDLLSCVMAGAKHGCIWITLQSHSNIVAVAALLEISAIIVTEGAMPDTMTINKANEEGVIILSTDIASFEVVGKLWELGVDHS
jgi:hypothetical protein